MTGNDTKSQNASATHEAWHANAMTLYVTFGLLMLLLVGTVVSAEYLSGVQATTAGLTVSVLKTLLIVAIFMNLRGSPSAMRLVAVAAVLWLSFAIMITLSDFIARGWEENEPHVIHQDLNPSTGAPVP